MGKKKDDEKAEDTGVYVLGNLDRTIDNPFEDDKAAEDREPLWYQPPVTALDAAKQSKELEINVQPKEGVPWTIRRTMLTLLYVHGQIEDVDALEQASKMRARMRGSEDGTIKLVSTEIKFIRDMAKKMNSKDSKMRIPTACWEALTDELKIAETMSAKKQEEAAAETPVAKTPPTES